MSQTPSPIHKEITERILIEKSQPKRGFVNVDTLRIPTETDINFYFNFLCGARIELHGLATEKTYTIRFFNKETGLLLKEDLDVKAGEWCSSNEEYYIPWVIQIQASDGSEPKSYSFDMTNKNVFIAYESSALGDTIAWMPYVEEFRKKHNCNIICSSYHNDMFKDIYPNINFVERGLQLPQIEFAYKLGWFGTGDNINKNPRDCHSISLQALACDILGFDYDTIGEIVPKLKRSLKGRKMKQKYVCITCSSTAQFKFYNKTGGWDEVVKYLIKLDYIVVEIGKQPSFIKNVYGNRFVNYTGTRDMDDIINLIQFSDFFIGLPSGLSWLSWGLGKKSIMITGISEHFCEYQNEIYRCDTPINKCTGCFNKVGKQYHFDRGDWLFCPDHKNTERHFECSKSITFSTIKNKIDLIIKHLKSKTSVSLDKDGNLVNKTNGMIYCKYRE